MATPEEVKKRLARLKAEGPDKSAANDDPNDEDDPNSEFVIAIEPTSVTGTNQRRTPRPKL